MAESCLPLSSGGYDCDFVDSIPESLSCPVCLLPFRDPHLLDCCGIKICATCVGRIDAGDQPCPQCRERFVHIQDKGTTRQVLGLKTRCSRNKDGCKWEGELRHLYTHEKDECGWALVVCSYMCGASFPRSQLTEHEYHVCPRRPVDVKLESFMCKVEAKLALERDCHQKEIVAVKEQFNKILYDERESHRRELAVVRKELTDVLDKERESRKREIAALREEFKSFCQEPETGFWKERQIQAEKYATSKQQLTRQFCVTETMDDRGISQLSSSQIKELKREASLKHVNIEFGHHSLQSKIELQGSQADVLHMKNKIQDILKQGHKVGSSSAARSTFHMTEYKPSKPTLDLWTTSGMGKPWHVAPNLVETSTDMDKVVSNEAVATVLQKGHLKLGQKPQHEKSNLVAVPQDPLIFQLDKLVASYLRSNPKLVTSAVSQSSVRAKVDDNSDNIVVLPTNSSPPDWQQICRAILTALTKEKAAKATLPIPKEASGEVLPVVMKESQEKGLKYESVENMTSASVVGEASAVASLQATVKEINASFVTRKENIAFDSDAACVFFEGCRMAEMSSLHPKLKVSLDHTKQSLAVFGCIRDLTVFKEEFPSLCDYVPIRCQFQPLELRLLSQLNHQEIVQEAHEVVPYFQKFSTAAYPDFFSLLSSPQQVGAAEDIAASIRDKIKMEHRLLPRLFKMKVVNSPDFVVLLQELKQMHTFVHELEEGKLIVAGMRDSVSTVSQALIEFIKERCTVTREVDLKRAFWQLLSFDTKMNSKWMDCLAEIGTNVQILKQPKPSSKKLFLELKGEPHLIDEADERIKALQSSVCQKSLPLVRPGIAKFFKHSQNRNMLYGIQAQAKVSIEIGTEEQDADERKLPPQSSKFVKVCSGSTHQLKTVNVYVGDITEFNRAEVIVNAANERLQHIGGIALAIARKGGPIIQEESDEHVRRRGTVETGKAVLFTKTGNLPPPYKAIVHAVRPIWNRLSATHDRDIALLKKVCMRALVCAKSYGSISIPAISSGVYGFPINVCADTLIQAVIEFSEMHEDSELTDIYFIIQQNNASAFQRAMEKHIDNVLSHQSSGASSSSFLSFASHSVNIGTTRTQQPSRITNTHIPCTHWNFQQYLTTPSASAVSPRVSSGKKVVSSESQSSSATSITAIGSRAFTLTPTLQLVILQGDVSDDDSHVIVNTTNEQLNLAGASAVSKAISRKGGQALQQICDSIMASQGQLHEGNVLITTATGNLKCHEVFHVVFISGHEGRFVETIFACLNKAEERKHQSIAFPAAISTGVSGYSTAKAAKGMVKALHKFISKKPRHMRRIRIVLFEQQMYMYQEFTEAFLSMKKEENWYTLGLKAFGSLMYGLNSKKENDMEEIAEKPAAVAVERIEEEEEREDPSDCFGSDVSSELNEIVISIFGRTKDTLRHAEKLILEIVKEQFIHELLLDKEISKLTHDQVKALEKEASLKNVEIEIDTDPALHQIKLHACRADVLYMKDKVREAVYEVREALAKLEWEKVMLSAAKTHIRWVRQLSDSDENYDEVLNYKIEQAYEQKKPGYQCNNGHDEFIIDFKTMQETDLVTGDIVKVKRVDLAEAEKSTEWDPMPTDSQTGNKMHVHLVTLKPGSTEYNYVNAYFKATMVVGQDFYQLMSIKRVQNPNLYGQYMIQKKQMDKHNPQGTKNERWLFHGATADLCEKINTQGFNRSFKGKNGTVYGEGVYFARDAHYSHRYARPDASGNRWMYLTRVLTGEFTASAQGMLLPPAKNPQVNANVMFDSTVDNVANPTIFVTYFDARNYPAYLITYN